MFLKHFKNHHITKLANHLMGKSFIRKRSIKYLNQIYHVSREVKDRSTGVITQSADYSQLGDLLLVSILIGLALPLCCVLLLRLLRLRTA